MDSKTSDLLESASSLVKLNRLSSYNNISSTEITNNIPNLYSSKNTLSISPCATIVSHQAPKKTFLIRTQSSSNLIKEEKNESNYGEKMPAIEIKLENQSSNDNCKNKLFEYVEKTVIIKINDIIFY